MRPPIRYPNSPFASPALQSSGAGLTAAPQAQTGLAGLGVRTGPLSIFGAPQGSPAGLPPLPSPGVSSAELEQMRVDARNRFPQPQAPAAPQQPRMMFNESTGQMWVNGFTFNERDALDGINSQRFLQQPPAAEPPPSVSEGWRALGDNEYADYLNEINNPSFGRSFGESVQAGFRGMGSVATGALALTGIPGVEEWAREARGELEHDLEQDSPFILNPEDVHDFGSGATFAAQQVGQMTPWVIEGIIQTGAVALTAGPAAAWASLSGTLEAALASRAAIAVARRSITAELTRQGVTRLTAAEVNALTRSAVIRARQQVARRVVGASAATGYATAAGDNYGEMIDRGVDQEPGARGIAALNAVPYAATEMAEQLFPVLAATGRMTNLLGRSRLARLGRGTAAGAVLGGAQEGYQEYNIMSGAEMAGADPLPSDEANSRITGAVLGGAIGQGFFGGVGGAIGGRSNRPTPPPATATTTPPVTPPAGTPPVAPPVTLANSPLADPNVAIPMSTGPVQNEMFPLSETGPGTTPAPAAPAPTLSAEEALLSRVRDGSAFESPADVQALTNIFQKEGRVTSGARESLSPAEQLIKEAVLEHYQPQPPQQGELFSAGDALGPPTNPVVGGTDAAAFDTGIPTPPLPAFDDGKLTFADLQDVQVPRDVTSVAAAAAAAAAAAPVSDYEGVPLLGDKLTSANKAYADRVLADVRAGTGTVTVQQARAAAAIRSRQAEELAERRKTPGEKLRTSRRAGSKRYNALMQEARHLDRYVESKLREQRMSAEDIREQYERAKDFGDQGLYPHQQPVKVPGEEVTVVPKEGSPQDATFVTKDIEFTPPADGNMVLTGGKKSVKLRAFTYYISYGYPIRRDVFEQTMEPADGSEFGADGKFKKKADIPKFKGVVASEAGTVTSLEAEQKYEVGDLVLTGLAGEQWPQDLEKARGKFTGLEDVKAPEAALPPIVWGKKWERKRLAEVAAAGRQAAKEAVTPEAAKAQEEVTKELDAEREKLATAQLIHANKELVKLVEAQSAAIRAATEANAEAYKAQRLAQEQAALAQEEANKKAAEEQKRQAGLMKPERRDVVIAAIRSVWRTQNAQWAKLKPGKVKYQKETNMLGSLIHKAKEAKEAGEVLVGTLATQMQGINDASKATVTLSELEEAHQWLMANKSTAPAAPTEAAPSQGAVQKGRRLRAADSAAAPPAPAAPAAPVNRQEKAAAPQRATNALRNLFEAQEKELRKQLLDALADIEATDVLKRATKWAAFKTELAGYPGLMDAAKKYLEENENQRLSEIVAAIDNPGKFSTPSKQPGSHRRAAELWEIIQRFPVINNELPADWIQQVIQQTKDADIFFKNISQVRGSLTGLLESEVIDRVTGANLSREARKYRPLVKYRTRKAKNLRKHSDRVPLAVEERVRPVSVTDTEMSITKNTQFLNEVEALLVDGKLPEDWKTRVAGLGKVARNPTQVGTMVNALRNRAADDAIRVRAEKLGVVGPSDRGAFSTPGDFDNVIPIGDKFKRLATVRKVVDRINRLLNFMPDVTVVSDINELEKNHAELFQAAVDAYPPGAEEFRRQAHSASAYSFGNRVVMFADRIRPGTEALEYIHELLHGSLHVIYRKPNLELDRKAHNAWEQRLGIDQMREDLQTNGIVVDRDTPFNVVLEWLKFSNPEIAERAEELAADKREHYEAIEEAVVERLADQANEPLSNPSAWGKFVDSLREAIRTILRSVREFMFLGSEENRLEASNKVLDEMLARSMLHLVNRRKAQRLVRGIAKKNMNVLTGRGTLIFDAGAFIPPVDTANSNLKRDAMGAMVLDANEDALFDPVDLGAQPGAFSTPPTAAALLKQARQTALNATAAEVTVPFMVGQTPLPSGLDRTDFSSVRDAWEAVKTLGSSGVATLQQLLESTSNVADRIFGAERIYDMIRETSAIARGWQNQLGRLRELIKTATAEEAAAASQIMQAVSGNGHALSSERMEQTLSALVEHLDGRFSIDEVILQAQQLQFIPTATKLTDGSFKLFINTGSGPVDAGTFTYNSSVPIARALELAKVEWDAYRVALHGLATEQLGKLNRARTNAFEDVVSRIGDSTLRDNTRQWLTQVEAWYRKANATVRAMPTSTKVEKLEKAQAQAELEQGLTGLLRALHSAEKATDWASGIVVVPGVKLSKHDKAANDLVEKWRTGSVAWTNLVDTELGSIITNMAGVAAKGGVSLSKQVNIKKAIQGIAGQRQEAEKIEERIRKALISNHVAFRREGKYEVRINVVNADGHLIDLPDSVRELLLYTRTDNPLLAKKIAGEAAERLEGIGTIEVTDKEGNVHEAFFVPVSQLAAQRRTLSNRMSSGEFISVLEAAGIRITQPSHERIVNLLGGMQGDLKQTGTPGQSEDQIKANSEFFDSVAYLIAAQRYQDDMASVMSNVKNWHGDTEYLRALETIHAANMGTPLQRETGDMLRRYAYQMSHMSAYDNAAPTFSVVIDGKAKTYKKMGNRGLTDPRSHIAWLVEQVKSGRNLQFAEGKSEFVQNAKLLAAGAQLGNIIAPLVNVVGGVQLLIVWAAGYNKKSGFGGGYGWANTTTNVFKALALVTTHKGIAQWKDGLIDQAFVEHQLEEAKKGNPTVLPQGTLEIILEEMIRGSLQPQQQEMLQGNMNKIFRKGIFNKSMNFLLKFFGDAERVNRLTALLSVYWMESERMIAESGGTITQAQIDTIGSPEHAKIRAQIEKAIEATQFNYAQTNMPAILRGEAMGLLSMYKMFPINFVQMIYNLPTREQTILLGMIFLMAGVKGEPFAENLMDLYDALLQKLGFQHDSVERQIAELADSIVPGSAPIVLNGVLDQIGGGGTWSSRFSMGRMLPMTGALREGADFGREVDNLFGPVWSVGKDSAEWGMTIASFAASAVNGRADSATAEDVVRTTPFSGIRGLGEAFIIGRDGEITDSSGRLVSDNVDFATVLSRAVGLYPVEATRANSAIRLSAYHDAYMRNVRARFVLTYANASRRGDTARMADIEATVSRWNDAAEMANRPDLRVTNFRRSAMRAARVADDVLVKRKSDSDAANGIVDGISEILNADDESDSDN